MQTETLSSPELTALDFQNEIERLTQDFVGREWILDDLDTWVKTSGDTFYILTGEAGVGKSAIAAHFTQIRDDIAAFNFCIYGRGSTIIPSTVLRSLAAQLGKNLPDYGLALANTIKPTYLSVNVKIDVGTMNGGQVTAVIIRNLTIPEPKQEVESLLTAPLNKLDAPPRPVLLLIDSLDEAFRFSEKENLVTLLAGLNSLPHWVRVVLTSRPQERVMSYFASVAKRVLVTESQLNREDLRRYVVCRVGKRTLRERLKRPETYSAQSVRRSSCRQG